jgi:hypothetical protein
MTRNPLRAMLLTAWVVSSAPAFAQQPAPSEQPSLRDQYTEILRANLQRDAPLVDVLALEEFAAKHGSAADYPGSNVMSLLYENQSFMGNYSAALRIFDERLQKYSPSYGPEAPVPRPPVEDFASLQPVAALDALVELAAKAQVVMINEAHHVPLHRAFTMQVLPLLKQQGFTYFAAETFVEDEVLRQRGYPVLASGRYVREPVFAEMVRTAIRAGYRLVQYEAAGRGGVDPREQGQARNLIDRILKADPAAKIVVHAGFGHIDEQNEPQKWMAQYFKEWSGIDPLTVDQTEMMEHSAPKYENALYARALERHRFAQPTVFRNSEGGYWSSKPGRRDLTVFHPRTQYRNARPDWLSLQGMRSPYALPKDICQSAANCLVRARRIGEAEDAIATDVLEVQAGPAPANLMLPVGEFNVTVEDAVGKQLRNFVARIGNAQGKGAAAK